MGRGQGEEQGNQIWFDQFSPICLKSSNLPIEVEHWLKKAMVKKTKNGHKSLEDEHRYYLCVCGVHKISTLVQSGTKEGGCLLTLVLFAS